MTVSAGANRHQYSSNNDASPEGPLSDRLGVACEAISTAEADQLNDNEGYPSLAAMIAEMGQKPLSRVLCPSITGRRRASDKQREFTHMAYRLLG